MTALDEKVVQNVRRKLSASEAQRRPARGPEPAQAQATVHAEKKTSPGKHKCGPRVTKGSRLAAGSALRSRAGPNRQGTAAAGPERRQAGLRKAQAHRGSGRRGRPAVGARRVVIQGDTPVRDWRA